MVKKALIAGVLLLLLASLAGCGGGGGGNTASVDISAYTVSLLPSGFYSYRDINDAGQMVFLSDDGVKMLQPDGQVKELAFPPDAVLDSSDNVFQDITVSLGSSGLVAFGRWCWGADGGLLNYDCPEHGRFAAVNRSGQIAGYFIENDGASTKAALWQTNGTYKLFTQPSGYAYAHPRSINDQGQVVGSVCNVLWGLGSWPSDQLLDDRAVVWDSNGSVHMLPLPKDTIYSRAYSINNLGQIAGSYADSNGTSHAIIWNRDGSIKILRSNLPDFPNSTACDINNRGVVVGYTSSTPENTQVWSWQGCAVVWNTRGDFAELPSPVSDPIIGGFSYAWAVNNQGQIIGHHHGASVTWTPN